MVKVSPEIKRIADKYCDETGGPPREREVLHRPGTQYVEELPPVFHGLDLASLEGDVAHFKLGDELASRLGKSEYWQSWLSKEREHRLVVQQLEAPMMRGKTFREYYLDEFFFHLPQKPEPKPKSPPRPAKPWEKFNPTPKSPRK